MLFISFAIRPLYFVGYVAYFELNIDYIIESYCENKEKPQLQCNGKCHLVKQLTPTTSSEENNLALNSLAESFFPVFYLEYNYQKIQKSFRKKCIEPNTIFNNLYSFTFEYDHFKPPIV